MLFLKSAFYNFQFSDYSQLILLSCKLMAKRTMDNKTEKKDATEVSN